MQGKPRIIAVAVIRLDIIAHHIADLARCASLQQLDLSGAGAPALLVEQRFPFFEQRAAAQHHRLRRFAFTCDRACVDHHRQWIHLILKLPDACPADIQLRAVKVEATRRGTNAIDFINISQSGFLCIFLHGLTAQFYRQGSEGAVAGVGKGAVKIHLAMRVRAGDLFSVNLIAAGAGKGPAVQILHLLDCGRRRHQLEY